MCQNNQNQALIKKDGGLNILRSELWQPPPFLGSWNNNPISMGLKKVNKKKNKQKSKKGKGILVGKNYHSKEFRYWDQFSEILW